MRRSPEAHRPRRVPSALPVLTALVAVALAVIGGAAIPPAQAQQPAPRVLTNLEYGAPGDASNLLDAYLPEDGRTGRAAIVVVHGGGWVGGDRSLVAQDAEILATKGFVAFSIEYGTTRPVRWPSELEDVQRAVRWVQDHAGEYGVDPAKIGLLGSSAGGHLSMLVGTRGVGDATHAPVKAVASWSGPSDLTTLAPTAGTQTTLPPALAGGSATTKPPSACVGQPACIGLLGPEYIETFLGCSLDDCPETYVDASPVFHVSSSTPPMLLAGAQQDLIPVSQNYEMVNALTAAGITSRLQVIEGTQHAESYRSVSLPPTIEFFDQFLNQAAAPTIPAGSPPTTVAGSQAIPALVDGKLPTPPVPAVATDAAPVRFVKQHLVWVVLGTALVALLGVTAVLVRTRGRAGSPPVRSR